MKKRQNRKYQTSDFATLTLPAIYARPSFQLHKRALETIEKEMERIKISFLASVYECESPIEQLFRVAFETRLITDMILKRKLKPYHAEIHAMNQEQIGEYRVDFLIQVYVHPPDGNSGIPVGVVVECDGHDFHEKTKQQAAKDKARDRYLQMHGYKVIRFTGSEIWKNPDRCAEEAIDIVVAELERIITV